MISLEAKIKFARWVEKDRERQEAQRENDAINDALGGFDNYALGYRVSETR